tara:strand:+ start:121 stop:360 length:240 start_codon:yes stop_codon:yes gene_type:complete
MTRAMEIGFAIMKNYPNDQNPYSHMVNEVATEFLSTAIAFLEQGQEDYIERIFPGISEQMIESGRAIALRRLNECIGGR